eukprot:15636306-Heterocapsa_arctica.AAC.1
MVTTRGLYDGVLTPKRTIFGFDVYIYIYIVVAVVVAAAAAAVVAAPSRRPRAARRGRPALGRARAAINLFDRCV